MESTQRLSTSQQELGEDQLVAIATRLADTTFASEQAQLQSSKALLRTIFELRARRIVGARTNQRLTWIRETGARVRFLEAVEKTMSMTPIWSLLMGNDLTAAVGTHLSLGYFGIL